jgi:hypothetical protein
VTGGPVRVGSGLTTLIGLPSLFYPNFSRSKSEHYHRKEQARAHRPGQRTHLHPVARDDAFPGHDRFYSTDPFENRLEFLAVSAPIASP